MSNSAIFYSRWCFYCKATVDDLQPHVMGDHPDSARARNYIQQGGEPE